MRASVAREGFTESGPFDQSLEKVEVKRRDGGHDTAEARMSAASSKIQWRQDKVNNKSEFERVLGST